MTGNLKARCEPWPSLLMLLAFVVIFFEGGPWVGGPRAVEAAENRYGVAVIIGNKNYQDRIPDVAYAHRDADAMSRYVRDVLQYREDNIIDLRDATLTDLVKVFGSQASHQGRLWRYVRPQRSDVIVYYSGHGVPDPQKGTAYLLPVDADPDAPNLTSYPLEQLYTNIEKLGAREITVYLDACFSGDSEKGMLIRSASPFGIQVDVPQTQESNLAVLTAASGSQLASWDEENQHGLFTEYLLRALYGEAPGADDGQMTLAEVKSYLDDELSYAARRQHGRVQVPTVKGPDDLVLVAWPGGRPPQRPKLEPAALPTPEATAPTEREPGAARPEAVRPEETPRRPTAKPTPTPEAAPRTEPSYPAPTYPEAQPRPPVSPPPARRSGPQLLSALGGQAQVFVGQVWNQTYGIQSGITLQLQEWNGQLQGYLQVHPPQAGTGPLYGQHQNGQCYLEGRMMEGFAVQMAGLCNSQTFEGQFQTYSAMGTEVGSFSLVNQNAQ